MKDLFQRFKGEGRSREPVEPRLSLAAFGKHPGWDDHIPGIGVETEALAHVKQVLYVTGIGGQIDAGAWEKLEAEKRQAGFDHTFLWLQAGHVLLGQFWSSTDGKGRAKYPMVLCIDSEGIPPEFLLGTLLPGMERLRDACKASSSAAAVTNNCQVAQDQLRSLLGPGKAPATAGSSPESRQRFFDRSELGPERQGVLRILHDLKSAPVAVPGARGVAAQGATRSHSLRVPLAANTPADGLLVWGEFLRCVIPDAVPLLLFARAGAGWLDVIVGEPATDDFFCLQATPKATPLATEIPYTLAADAKQQLQAIEAGFLGVQPPPPQSVPTPVPLAKPSPPVAPPVTPPVPAPAPAPPASAPASTAPATTRPASPPAPDAEPRSTNRMPLFIGLGIVAVLAVGGGWFLLGGRASSPSTPTASGPTPTATAAASPGTQVAVAPQPDEHARQYAAALAAAQTAAGRKDFSSMLAQAQAALALKPGDPTATQLKSDAQQALAMATAAAAPDNAYLTAMSSAQAALGRQDYTTAQSQADAALKLKPGDAPALKLKADVQTGLAAQMAVAQTEKDFQSALAAAHSAFDRKDYSTAQSQADAALKLKPGDATALKLKTEAGQGMATELATARAEKDYAAAMQAGQSAFARKDLATAQERAGAALRLKPNDAAALQLKDDTEKALTAQTAATQLEREYSMAMAAAQAALAHENYAEARLQSEVALKAKPDDAAARQLKTNAAKGEENLSAAARAVSEGQAALGRNDYAAAQQRAEAALKLRPNDTLALKLKDDASQAMAAATAARKEAAYQAAISAAQAALEAKDYSTVQAQADAALKLKPGDTLALKLKADAQLALSLATAKPATAPGQATPPTAAAAIPAPGGGSPFTNSLGMEFVWVPAVGAYIGKYEVTQGQFTRAGKDLPEQRVKDDDVPVANVSFDEAQSFCRQMSQKDGRHYGLLSRSQFLAAAGVTPDQALSAWTCLTSNLLAATLSNEVISWHLKPTLDRPARVGSRGTQTNGLADVLGNVREWIQERQSAGFSFDTEGYGSRKVLFQGEDAGLQKITGLRCIVQP